MILPLKIVSVSDLHHAICEKSETKRTKRSNICMQKEMIINKIPHTFHFSISTDIPVYCNKNGFGWTPRPVFDGHVLQQGDDLQSNASVASVLANDVSVVMLHQDSFSLAFWHSFLMQEGMGYHYYPTWVLLGQKCGSFVVFSWIPDAKESNEEL